MLRLNNCAICLWKREIACFNIGRVHVGFFFIIIHLNPHFKDIFTIICLYRCVCDINMCRGKSHSKIDAPAWRLWINTNKRSAISRLHKLLIKLVASLNQNLPTHNLGNKNAINTYNIYNRCILHSRPCSGNDHPICKVSISYQKSFTIHVIARTKIISPIIYSNWEIANTWQIKTSKYSCDLNKTAHLVAISWTLADIHGQWVRRSFTHINSAHNTTPHPSLNNETKSVYKGLYPV